MGRARRCASYQDCRKCWRSNLCTALGKLPPHLHSKICTNASQITNSAPNHNVLGTLNGLAQTLSAAGRAVGPFISGSLFTASTKLKPKGEALAFGVFAGVSLIGFLLSFGIRGSDLEAEGWSSDDESGDEEEHVASDREEEEANERSGLMRK